MTIYNRKSMALDGMIKVPLLLLLLVTSSNCGNRTLMRALATNSMALMLMIQASLSANHLATSPMKSLLASSTVPVMMMSQEMTTLGLRPTTMVGPRPTAGPRPTVGPRPTALTKRPSWSIITSTMESLPQCSKIRNAEVTHSISIFQMTK